MQVGSLVKRKYPKNDQEQREIGIIVGEKENRLFRRYKDYEVLWNGKYIEFFEFPDRELEEIR